MCSATSHCNRTRFRSSSGDGYTLIEVLVAMAIFTAMLVLAGAALNQGLRQYQGLVEKGLGFWDYAKTIWIDKSFNSATDYYVYTRADRWFPYFKGNQEGISFVSLAPFAGEDPVVVWIKNESQADGKRTLRYYELPVFTKTSEDIEREGIFEDYKKGKSFQLLEDAEDVAISFYGCGFVDRQCRWVNAFDGARMRLLPSSVKIEYTQKGENGVLLFTIHVNSYLKQFYNEI